LTVPENEYIKLARRNFLAKTRLRALWELKYRHLSDYFKHRSVRKDELVSYYEELAYAQVKREDFPRELKAPLFRGAREKAQNIANSRALVDLKVQYISEYILILDTLRSVTREV